MWKWYCEVHSFSKNFLSHHGTKSHSQKCYSFYNEYHFRWKKIHSVSSNPLFFHISYLLDLILFTHAQHYILNIWRNILIPKCINGLPNERTDFIVDPNPHQSQSALLKPPLSSVVNIYISMIITVIDLINEYSLCITYD